MKHTKRIPPSRSTEGGFLWNRVGLVGLFAVTVAVLLGVYIVPAFAVELGEPAPIVVEVIFEGISAASEGEIKAVLGTHSQEPLSFAVVQQDIRAIYALGYFREVSVLQSASSDGVSVVYRVVEQPLVEAIEFIGAAEGDVPDLRSVISLESGKPWSFALALTSSEEMIAYYRRSGYTQAQIEITPPPTDATAWIASFIIERGPRARVFNVEIVGNQFFSDTSLGATIGSHYRSFLDPKGLENDMKAIEDRYQQHGFYFCEVVVDHYEYLEKYGEPWVRVFLRVKEGPRVMMGQVKVTGNEVFSDAHICTAFMPRQGYPFSPSTARESVSTIQGMYGARGYLYAFVDTDLHYDEHSETMDVDLIVYEHNQVHVGDIIVEGANKTQWMVFKHMLLLKQGDVFSSTRLIESWRRLYNLGFFESVSMEPMTTDDPDVLDLVIRVKELDRWGQLYLGATYNGSTGFEGFIQYQCDNLWGQGKLVSVNWEFGEKVNNYELSYADRWLFDSSTRLDLNLYSKDSRYEEEEEGYTKYESGVEVGLGSPWFSNLSVSLSTKKQNTIIGTIEGKDLPAGLASGTTTYLSLKPALKWDSRVRDKGFNPYEGLYGYASFEKSGGFLGGNVDFNRYFIEGRTYLRTAAFWTSPTIGLRVRQMWGDNLPVDEEFYIGGQDSLRGYGTNEFRGTNVLLGTLELRVPLDESMLGYMFVDGGNIIRQGSEDLFKVGFGFGMKMQTAIGTLRLDYGVGESGSGRFYFGMGDVF